MASAADSGQPADYLTRQILLSVFTWMACDSRRSESLYSSKHRWRHRRESGKSKGGGGTESRPIPKQAFAGSNPVTRSISQKKAHPASDRRPDALKVTYPLSKDSSAHASPIHVSASVKPTLVCVTAATIVTPRRESHYSESSLSSALQRSICHMQPPAASIFVQGRRIMREGHFIRELPRPHLA